MIPTTRSEALSLLAELSELSSDVRLGQLFAHLGFLGEDQTGRSLWDIDDEQLLAVLYHHRAELIARLRVESQPLPPANAVGAAAHGPAASAATLANEVSS